MCLQLVHLDQLWWDKHHQLSLWHVVWIFLSIDQGILWSRVIPIEQRRDYQLSYAAMTMMPSQKILALVWSSKRRDI